MCPSARTGGLRALLLLVLMGVAGRAAEREPGIWHPRQLLQRRELHHGDDERSPFMETFVDLLRKTDYHVEEHDVTTDDGYILIVHRIPGGPRAPVRPRKPVVLLIHGLLAASDIWALRGPDHDLAFMLVDAGYDVWLMNTRGNFYCRRHKKLQPKEEKFWRFSWHESGVYDTRNTIDHILSITGEERLSVISHSMGTTMSLVLLSLKPEYNAKVAVMVSYAPIAIFTHFLPGPISTIAVRYGRQLQKTFKTLGVNEVFPRNPGLVGIYAAFCQTPHIELLCQQFIMNIAGLLKSSQFDAIDISMMPKVIKHYPQGSSLDTLLHYKQVMISRKFRQFDFGPDGNYIRYKNSTPPEYPLERVTVPTILYYGLNDAYTTEKDVLALMERLPKAEVRKVHHERFGHLDFLFSNLTSRLVYDDTLRALDRYNDRYSDRDRITSLPSPEQSLDYGAELQAPTTVTV